MNPKLRKCALIVDDDPSVRSALGKVLRKAGYAITEAANGQEAITPFTSQQIDLVLLDLNLHLENGWNVFGHLTSLCPFVPIIIITALPDQYPTAQAAGVGAILEKPIDVPSLLQVMRELLTEPHEARLRRLCGYQHDIRYVPSINAYPDRPSTAGSIPQNAYLRSHRRGHTWVRDSYQPPRGTIL